MSLAPRVLAPTHIIHRTELILKYSELVPRRSHLLKCEPNLNWIVAASSNPHPVALAADSTPTAACLPHRNIFHARDYNAAKY